MGVPYSFVYTREVGKQAGRQAGREVGVWQVWIRESGTSLRKLGPGLGLGLELALGLGLIVSDKYRVPWHLRRTRIIRSLSPCRRLVNIAAGS